MEPVIRVGIVLAAVAGAFSIGNAILRMRFRRIKGERVGVITPLADRVSVKNLQRWQIGEIESVFRRWAADSAFPVLPSDSLSDIYGIVDDDVWRTLLQISERVGIDSQVHFSPAQPLTVMDVVRFFDEK